MSDPVRFLSRWSRLKRQASVPAAPPVATEVPATAVPDASPATAAESPAITCSPEQAAAIDRLGIDSDFSVYMQAKVGEGLRRQAMKKLFADPHFNVMDGLDVYIDDYSISDPIPDQMLAGLKQMQRLFPADPAGETASTPPPTATDAAIEFADAGEQDKKPPAADGPPGAADTPS